MLLFPTSTWILSISQAPFQLELLQNLLLVHPVQTPRSVLVLLGFSLRIPGGLQNSEPQKNQPGGSFKPSWNVPHPFWLAVLGAERC